jgi:hypothetical protein
VTALIVKLIFCVFVHFPVSGVVEEITGLAGAVESHTKLNGSA